MKSKSVIKYSDLVNNKNAYKTATKQYFCVYIVDEDGNFLPCLLTENDILIGKERANKNPEDVRKLSFILKCYYKIINFIKL